MGKCGSKKDDESGSLASSNHRLQISAMIAEIVGGKDKPVTRTALQSAWQNTLTEYMLDLFLNHLFKGSKQTIPLKDLVQFYHRLSDSHDVRALTIMSMIGTKDGITPAIFQEYTTNLIESYMCILKVGSPEAYYSWEDDDNSHRNDLGIVVDYCLNYISYSNNGNLDIEELEKWLVFCAFANEVFESTINYTFNIQKYGLEPFLPTCDRTSTELRIPLVLLLSHFTKKYNKGHWRQLYTSWSDPHSWTYMVLKILSQGPSLVIVEEDSGPLFGGFAPKSWEVNSGFYGNEDCFLFRLRPEVIIFKTSGHNKHYQYLYNGTGIVPSGLAFGGFINHFGLYLSPDFGPGKVSETCQTFENYVPLTENLTFYFSKIEVWGIGRADLKASMKSISLKDSLPLALARRTKEEEMDNFERVYRNPASNFLQGQHSGMIY